MSRRKHRYHSHPNLLTSIRTPGEMWRKTDWNFGRYEDEVLRRPCRAEDMMFAAIDFCVSVVSLRDWTIVRYLGDVRAGDTFASCSATDVDGFRAFVNSRIEWQGAVEAIARAAKHGTYNDDPWPEGIAMPASFVPEPLQEQKDELADGVQLFAFMHEHKDVAWWDVALKTIGEDGATPGYEAFGGTLDGWAEILEDLGYFEP